MMAEFLLIVMCPLLIIGTVAVYVKDMIQEIIRRVRVLTRLISRQHHLKKQRNLLPNTDTN